MKATCVLYRCKRGVLADVYVQEDTEDLSTMDMPTLRASQAWVRATAIIEAHLDHPIKCIMSDYERAGTDKLGLGLGTTSSTESFTITK